MAGHPVLMKNLAKEERRQDLKKRTLPSKSMSSSLKFSSNVNDVFNKHQQE
jgi:hypothetical protein